MRQSKLLLPLGLALALTGCISFGGKVPDSLLRLTATSTVPAATSRTGTTSEAVTVLAPSTPQELRTPRVPVRTGTSVAYLKDAQWVEMPGSLFGRLLSETIAARTGRLVLDPGQFAFDPGLRLTGQLQQFGIDAEANEAVVVYDAALARAPDTVETRRFEARVPVAAVDVANAGAALNQAANQVAAEVAGWIGG
ncbi:ABC-type transport auxiliary lipoprotein family protein [Allosphingosinicella humi]|jgi:cholesterol transport system auxiliary component